MTKFILDINNPMKRGFDDYKKANTMAIRNTLNIQAALTRKNAIEIIKEDFTLRNSFTEDSISFKKTRSKSIPKMESKAGALQRAKYMRLQELGGQRPDLDGRTSIGQADARIGRSKRKVVSKSLYITAVKKKIVRGPFKKKFKSSKAKKTAALFVAQKKKLFIKRNNNIYSVQSIHKSGGKVKTRISHIYSIQTRPLHIKPSPWLEPASRKPARDGENIFRSQIHKMLKNKKII